MIQIQKKTYFSCLKQTEQNRITNQGCDEKTVKKVDNLMDTTLSKILTVKVLIFLVKLSQDEYILCIIMMMILCVSYIIQKFITPCEHEISGMKFPHKQMSISHYLMGLSVNLMEYSL